jgi:integrase
MKITRSTYIGQPLSPYGDVKWSESLRQFTSVVDLEEGPRELELGTKRLRALDLNVEACQEMLMGRSFGAAQRLVDHRLGVPRERRMATIGEMCAVYAKLGDPENEQPQKNRITTFIRLADAVARQRCGLERVVRIGQDLAVEDFEVAKAPILLFDENFTADYLVAVAGKLKPRTPEYNRRLRSAAAEISAARGLFDADVMTSYEDEGQFVPLPVGFLTSIISTEDDSEPLVHDPVCVQLIFQLMAQALRDGAEQVFLILALALWGLRATDIANLQRSAVQRTTGYTIALRSSYESLRGGGQVKRHQKHEHPRVVTIPEWLYFRLLAWFDQSSLEYLLPGNNENARLVACDLASDWLRDQGFDFVRPLHTCRAFFAGYLCSTAPTIQVIISNLGHEDLATTITYYAKHPFKKRIVELWEREFPLQGPAETSAADIAA